MLAITQHQQQKEPELWAGWLMSDPRHQPSRTRMLFTACAHTHARQLGENARLRLSDPIVGHVCKHTHTNQQQRDNKRVCCDPVVGNLGLVGGPGSVHVCLCAHVDEPNLFVK